MVRSLDPGVAIIAHVTTPDGYAFAYRSTQAGCAAYRSAEDTLLASSIYAQLVLAVAGRFLELDAFLTAFGRHIQVGMLEHYLRLRSKPFTDRNPLVTCTSVEEASATALFYICFRPSSKLGAAID